MNPLRLLAVLMPIWVFLSAVAPREHPIVNQATQFPISFGGSEVAFGWALFSLLTVTALTLAAMIKILRAGVTYGWSIGKPLAIARMALFCLLMAILMEVAPDVVMLLTWREVPAETMQFILATDRAFDSLMLLPFLTGLGLLVRGEPAILFMLTKPSVPVDLRPNWGTVLQQGRIVILVMIIAAGVTVAK